MNSSSIDLAPDFDSVPDLGAPEAPDFTPSGSSAAAELDLPPGAAAEDLGATVMKAETKEDEGFGELSMPAEAHVVPEEGDVDSALFADDDPVAEQDADDAPQQAQQIEGNADEAPSTDDTVDVRQGFLSLFADQVEAHDPEAAAKIREYRDSSGRSEQDITDESAADRDESSGTGRSGEKKTTVMQCGKMSELVGVEDPHSAIGGFFHDLGQLLPWGGLLQTEYDKACNAWFEQHPGTFY